MDKSRNELINAIDKMIAVSKLQNLEFSGCAYLEFKNPVASGEDFEIVDVTAICVPFEEMTEGFKAHEVIVTKDRFLDGKDKSVSHSKQVFSFREVP